MSHLTIKAINNTSDFDQFDINELIEVLKEADDMYFNGGGSFLTDQKYDSLRRYVEQSVPFHEYFTGVGATVRGGKVKLPYEMGSLDQVYEGEITKWVDKWDLYNHEHIVSDKLDGISALLIYSSKGNLQIAYSRGNGVEGADITRHVQKIKNLPSTPVNTTFKNGIAVRVELIIPTENFPYLQQHIKTRAGKEYKNPRNMVAGLMNAKSNPDFVYQYIHAVAYDVMNVKVGSKEDFLSTLSQMGFNTVHYTKMLGSSLTDEQLTNYLNGRRSKTSYEIDGLVIDVNDSEKRGWMDPTRETLNPAHSVKYKVADASNIAISTVKFIDWNVSKHGYLKPRVWVEPVTLVGVTVTKATGFNAKFVFDNKIGPGAKVQITRSGDVIPFIQEVLEQAETPQMPKCDWDWNETGVDAIMSDFDSNINVTINRLVDFFSTLEIPFLKEGNITGLVEYGYKTPEKIINAPQKQISYGVGSDVIGKKIYTGMHDKLNRIELYKLIGAFSTERGIGVRKIKKIQQHLGQTSLLNITGLDEHQIFDTIVEIEGFDKKTARAAARVLHTFNDFYDIIKDKVTLNEDKFDSNGPLSGEKVVFTGFRDKNLKQTVENAGGVIQTSISGKTTIVVAANPNGNSTKLNKARENGARIVGIDQFKEMLNV